MLTGQVSTFAKVRQTATGSKVVTAAYVLVSLSVSLLFTLFFLEELLSLEKAEMLTRKVCAVISLLLRVGYVYHAFSLAVLVFTCIVVLRPFQPLWCSTRTFIFMCRGTAVTHITVGIRG